MNRLTSEELQAIRVRAEKATAGKWRVDYGVTAYDRTVTTESFEILCENVPPKDAEFIAYAREDVPKLVAEVERLRAAIIEAIADIETISPHEAKKTLVETLKEWREKNELT